MVNNQFDKGIQEDFDNMTYELGHEVTVYPRSFDLNYEGQEDTSSGFSTGMTEIAFIQILDEEHEMVQSGQLNIGDVRFTFQNDTIAEEEGKVIANGQEYKILKLTKIRGQSNEAILYVKGTGKKIPNR